MDAFVSRKRRRASTPAEEVPEDATKSHGDDEEESTDLKLAILASLHPEIDQEVLLDILLASDGSVAKAADSLRHRHEASPRKKPATRLSGPGYQASLTDFNISRTEEVKESTDGRSSRKLLTKKGKTLHLYAPADIEQHTPCSIIHNFLPASEADSLLRELLAEVPTYTRASFKLFDNIVQSPHTMCFYVDSDDEADRQKTEYVYNGSYITDVRRSLPEMRKVSAKVQAAVNAEIRRRIKDFYPGGKKLKYQSPHEWTPNAAFVNCYDGGSESVGYHSDQLTYLGPRAVIGSLSLGVAREFRVRRVVVATTTKKNDKEGSDRRRRTDEATDEAGQIAIHLPHNSLLVMHAEMQEEWKHAIAPAAAVEPHPVAGTRRINVTYRHYKPSLHPRFTPACACGVPTVLRCVQRTEGNRGRYMWMCHAGYAPEEGKEGCRFFKWAEFDEDGEPPWWSSRGEVREGG